MPVLLPPKRRARRPSLVLRTGLVSLAALGVFVCSSPSCALSDAPPTGAGGAAPVVVPPGELCTTPDEANLGVRFEPAAIALPPCADPNDPTCTTREVKVIVDPDVCAPRTMTFASSDASIVAAPASAQVTLHVATVQLTLKGGTKPGPATITVSLPTFDDGAGGATAPVTATLTVDVLDPKLPACSGTASKPALAAGETLAGTGGLAGAALSVPAGANNPNQNSFIWHIDPIANATLACGKDSALDGYVAVGPAITFGPETLSLPREIDLSVPVNPALVPSKARWRHVRVAYSGPAFTAPRTVAVADPRFEKIGGQWVFTFKASKLGTYQVIVPKDAGQTTRKRRLTHRAVVGISMGSAGAGTFGMRHHDLFDVVAPLGGFVSWTWFLGFVENHYLAGFRPIAPGTQLKDIQLTKTPCMTGSDCVPDETCLGVLASPPTPGKCTLLPPTTEPYEHPAAWDNFWCEFPRTGTGGSFARDEEVQVFRDLALMFGNPNGDNLTKGADNLPAGVPPTDPSVVGDHPNNECAVWVEPLDCADPKDQACAAAVAKQQEIANSCPAERCKHTLTLQNYFDDEYNPDGTFPVITFCDGSPQNQALTPFADTWSDTGNNYPVEVGLAVDYNGNGVRDELEPVIRAGHERWRDVGVDGLSSANEAGYVKGVAEDPAGDDYDPQYNPTGTEGNHRYEVGEPFDDWGLDGVAGTKQQPAFPVGYQKPGDGYDVGEGDGKFNASRGSQRFWNFDPWSVVRRMSDSVPGGELTDDALHRVDLWTDGGLRDIANFAIGARHLAGGFAARGRDVAYFTNVTALPGLDPTQPNQFNPARIVWDDLQGVVFHRYGHPDPSPSDIANGSGQHVGTVAEIASRLQSSLYFIGSRWPEPELRVHVEADNGDNIDPQYLNKCEATGTCTINFSGKKSGRTGPVGITLPPGYTNAKLQHIRYPVIYLLHGYGQKPQDLEAAIAFLKNWMNSPLDGKDSRLAKAILVYVDGRCRPGANGEAECIRGTFFTDSVRATGAQDETWWLELMDYMDQNYRTLGETEIDWTE